MSEVSETARRRALLAAFPDAILLLRSDGTCVDFAGDVSGLSTPADELVGSKVQELLPPEASEPLLDAVAEVLRTRAPAAAAYTVRRPSDGALCEFEARIAPAEGLEDETAVVVRDVTDERRAAREQASLRRIATLVASEWSEEELVSAIAEELGALFDADAANALRWDGDTLHVVGEWRRDRPPAAGGSTYAYGGDTISVRVVEASAPARVDSIDELVTEFARERWRALGIDASIGAPVRAGGVLWGVVTASRSHGRHPFPEGTEQRLADFATLLAQAIENAESRRRMTHVYEEQSALRNIATLVAGGRPHPQVLEEVTAEVGRLFEAREVNVVRWEGVLDEVVLLRSWAAPPAEPAEPGELRREAPGSAIIAVLEEGLAARSVNDDEAMVAAPLIINGVLRGALSAHRSGDEPFPAAAESRLRAFADLAAQSIGNDLIQNALRESRARIVQAGDDARRRLERNLHDGAQQRLVAVSLSLRHAATLFEKNVEGARELVASASAELTNAIQELRDLARGLHPAILSDQGLDAALRALVLRSPGDPTLENDIEVRLDEHVESAVYYVAAEALTNAQKYARATSVRVWARIRNDAVVLEVVDDGPGGARVAPGSGLQGLTDRVEAIGGRLEVHSTSGVGTTIRAVIPLTP